MIKQGMHLHRTEGDDRLGTLFYVHGMGESGSCFRQLCRHQGLGRWTHLVPDLVGYGDSPAAEEPPSLTEHAQRLAELLAAEHPEPVVVVGHSMGGAIGTMLIEEAPGRVRAFVNVEGNISLGDCHYSSRVAGCSEEEWLERGFTELVEELAGDSDPVIASYRASLDRCDPLTLHRNACQLVELSRGEELAGRLARCGRPVVYIHGRSDGGASERSLELLRDAGIEPRPIADAAHWPFLDQPDEFVSTTGAFLDGLGAVRRVGR